MQLNEDGSRYRVDDSNCFRRASTANAFVFSSCDFVDRPFVQKTKDDPRSHTNQHERKHSSLELDPTFEVKTIDTN